MKRTRVIMFLLVLVLSSVIAYNFGAYLKHRNRQNQDSLDLNTTLVRDRINHGQGYLYRMVDDQYGGAHKYYYFSNDTFKPRLHTTYTSTLLYTLLKSHTQIEERDKIRKLIPEVSEFLFFMQNTDEDSKAYGAFPYSFFTDKEEKDSKYVVGTNSKTIYTLLKLYNLTGREKYLDSAQMAADWLLTMQKEDGTMYSYRRLDDNGKWYRSTQHSILYNGEVLSALSRVYEYTQEDKYLEAADKIADNFKQHREKQGCYVGDDYRDPNPISSAWLVMSLLDYYRATGDREAKRIVFDCSRDLLDRQIMEEDDKQFGRWQRAYSTSGNGWLIEVLSQVYTQCKRERRRGCARYKNAIIRGMDWIMARTCTGDNCYGNQFAAGGIYWNNHYDYIRTDSVAHTLNGYIQTLGEFS